VPSSVIEFDKITSQELGKSSQGENHFLFSIKWTDEPSVQNYYRIYLEEKRLLFSDTIAYTVGDKVISDNKTQGMVMTDDFDYYVYNFEGADILSYYGYLLNTDIHYYEYHRRRINYYGDDPFSEPAPQYSNVSGGFGVICSFRKSGYPIVL
jgi:hypothetical protein